MSRSALIDMDEELEARLEALARSRHRASGLLLREAVEQYVEREERREVFLQETLASWEEYRRTGLHVTAEEVHDWLATWGTDDERPAPPVHK